MRQPVISIQNLRKSYGQTTAVDDVSLTVWPGEIFGLLGPNGAGKTTTLECLEGMRRADSGSLTIAGLNPVSQERAIRRLLGVQMQIASLPDTILPGEAMSLICAWHNQPVRLDLLTRFELDGRSGKKYYQLSTGQKRRLQLALALACNPSVVVLDEPTAGLDVQGRAQLHAAIRQLREQGLTIILATHDMAEAETLCDRIAIMVRGRIAAIGTPDQITSTVRRESRIRLRTATGSLLPGRDIGQALFVEQKDDYGTWCCQEAAVAVIDLLTAVQAAGDRVEDLRVERPSLEEAFLTMVENTHTPEVTP